MTIGVLLNGVQSGQQLPRWVEGIPDTIFGNLKLRNRPTLPVTSFRCQACGYVEFFAPPT